jgi:hypothetical protein
MGEVILTPPGGGRKCKSIVFQGEALDPLALFEGLYTSSRYVQAPSRPRAWTQGNALDLLALFGDAYTSSDFVQAPSRPRAWTLRLFSKACTPVQATYRLHFLFFRQLTLLHTHTHTPTPTPTPTHTRTRTPSPTPTRDISAPAGHRSLTRRRLVESCEGYGGQAGRGSDSGPNLLTAADLLLHGTPRAHPPSLVCCARELGRTSARGSDFTRFIVGI